MTSTKQPQTAAPKRGWHTVCSIDAALPGQDLANGDIGLPEGILPKVKDSAIVQVGGTRLELGVVRGSYGPCSFSLGQVSTLQSSHAGSDVLVRPWRFTDGFGKLPTAKGVTTVVLPLLIAVITLLSAIQGAADQTAKYKDLAEDLHQQLAEAATEVDLAEIPADQLAEITTSGQIGLFPDQPFPEPLTPRTPAQDRLDEAGETLRDASSELVRRSDRADRASSAAQTRLDDLAASPEWWQQSAFVYKALVFLIALLSAGLGVWSIRPGAE